MKNRLFPSLLGLAFLLATAHSQCDFSGGNRDVPFPDITKYVADSYILGVEYTVSGAKQTDYYTEYYEVAFKRGRIDGHQAGEYFKYIYQADTLEAWNVELNKCELLNISLTPEFFKDDMTEWRHFKGGQITTIGPSAMLKKAHDVWNNKAEKNNMMYMGKSENLIRGEKAVYYRRCTDNNSVDYFFAAKEEQNPFDTDLFANSMTPLRVAFNNLPGVEKEMAAQFYDIISFQPVIPSDMDPFVLPKGRNCSRDIRVEGPKLPDFSTSNMILSAEVLYQKYKIGDKENELKSSYYSTFMFALDREINHMAYLYSSWNTSKPDPDHQEPFLNMPKYIIYDLTHQLEYKINYVSDKCTVSRNKTYIPTYKLPENGGGIALTDPYVLFPNNELTYLTKGKERGLEVNIFEAAVENYVLDSETLIPKMIVTHSFLTDNEEMENVVSVRDAPTQIQMHLFRKEGIEEVLTFNIFGFSTKLPKKRYLFNLQRCFRNDDDYVYLTLGFEPDARYLPELEKKLGELEDNVLKMIRLKSELNAVRIPYVVSEIKDNFIFMTMLILDKPTPRLEFPNEEKDKTIEVATENDKQGISNFEVCANNCLETKNECWGFALCGATCYYGNTDNTNVVDKKGCSVFRRYSNQTAIQSKDVEVNNIVREVEAGQFSAEVTLESGSVQLKATVATVSDPAEDETLFTRMGNLLNPRMRVQKFATKLKKGQEVKNMGKLRYDECQQLCLDFKDCEVLSYCLVNSDCKLSSKFAVDLTADETEPDDFCSLLTRKYADHFERMPGVFATSEGGLTVKASSVEDCARECLRRDNYNCLSFDHCAGGKYEGCRLYTTHYMKQGTKTPEDNKNPRCGHYSRKFSSEFKKKEETRIMTDSFQVIQNLTLEECAKRCVEYENGACFGYDFCQGAAMYDTSCTLIDNDPSRFKSAYSPICSNFIRTGGAYSPRPYTMTYAGGIGFLCFLVGGLIGALVVFVIAYMRVNRG